MKRKLLALVFPILPRKKPNFIIVGAQKSGTSSLHHYLDTHPDLHGSSPKELHFFDHYNKFKKGYKWYEKSFVSFESIFSNGICYETSPSYLYRSFVPKRIHEYNPELKIIIVLRDPVKRAYSAWNMYRDFFDSNNPLPISEQNSYLKGMPSNLYIEFYSHEEFPSFTQVIEEDIRKHNIDSPNGEPAIVRRGIYLPQIKRYHKYFGKEKILVIGFKDLIENKVETLKKVREFIGVGEFDWSSIEVKKRNSRKYPNPMTESDRHILRDFYQDKNKELFKYLGGAINW